MNLTEFESKLNEWGREQVPFLFLVDFEMEKPKAWKIDEVPDEILFSINGFLSSQKNEEFFRASVAVFDKHSISISEY